jgi:hypothetical protein
LTRTYCLVLRPHENLVTAINSKDKEHFPSLKDARELADSSPGDRIVEISEEIRVTYEEVV